MGPRGGQAAFSVCTSATQEKVILDVYAFPLPVEQVRSNGIVIMSGHGQLASPGWAGMLMKSLWSDAVCLCTKRDLVDYGVRIA